MAESKVRWWESNRNLGFAGTVVAGLVLAALVYVFGLIPVWSWLVSAWRWLVHPVSVPFVVLIAMVGAFIVFAVGLLTRLTQPLPPPWLAYCQDNFLGIVWRWRYDAGNQLVESSITPFCPQCGIRLRGDQQGYLEMTTSFICDECPFKQDMPGNGPAVIERVARLVEREMNRRLGRI